MALSALLSLQMTDYLFPEARRRSASGCKAHTDHILQHSALRMSTLRVVKNLPDAKLEYVNHQSRAPKC